MIAHLPCKIFPVAIIIIVSINTALPSDWRRPYKILPVSQCVSSSSRRLLPNVTRHNDTLCRSGAGLYLSTHQRSNVNTYTEILSRGPLRGRKPAKEICTLASMLCGRLCPARPRPRRQGAWWLISVCVYYIPLRTFNFRLLHPHMCLRHMSISEDAPFALWVVILLHNRMDLLFGNMTKS